MFATQKISLAVALCGGQFSVTHLDDRVLIMTNPTGSVIKPGDVKVISGEGMPHYKRPFDKGDLFLTFEIEFPSSGWIDHAKLRQLEAFLPEKMKLDIHADAAQEVDMIDFDPHTHGGRRGDGNRGTSPPPRMRPVTCRRAGAAVKYARLTWARGTAGRVRRICRR